LGAGCGEASKQPRAETVADREAVHAPAPPRRSKPLIFFRSSRCLPDGQAIDLLLSRDHGPAALRAQAVFFAATLRLCIACRFVDIVVIDKIAGCFVVAAGRRIVASALNLALVLRLIVGYARSNAESKTWLPQG
jgi:hypothetical protein